jgi:peptidoglycan/LPS O-acetylase OafA/YrhL
MSEPAATARAYRTLDGLRGVAALIVVTRHAGDFFPGELFPESFLAVDLFFLLSGFVIAHAYEARLLAGRSLGSFLKTRLVRLYPLYMLGLVLGVTAALVRAKTSAEPLDAGWLAEAMGVGVLMLPAVPPLPMGSSALDGPTWTLAPELLANLAYAATIRKLRGRALTALTGLGAVSLIASQAVYGSLDGGWSPERFPLIGARLAFSFFLGVAMFRTRPTRRTGPLAAWGCLAAVAAALMFYPSEHLRRGYELAVVLLVFPLTVAVAVRHEPDARSAPTFRTLGLVSYAVYVMHQPLGALAAALLKPASLLSTATPLTAGLFLAVCVALAALADRFYDAPLRRWLTRLDLRALKPRLAGQGPQRA